MPGLPSKPNNIPLASSLPKVSFRHVPFEEVLPRNDIPDPQNVDFGFNDGSPFVRPERYLRYVEPIESELKKQVEYDMDEQDQEWLNALNADRRRDKLDVVTNEMFEIIIDQLEKEYFDLMKQVPSKHAHGQAEDGEDGDDDGEDTKCAICDDGEGENSNAIVFCDGCNLAVHQDCYGIPYVPEGQWLCRKCTVSPDRAVSCILCPHEGGAFKQTTLGKWAHLLCAMWIPEIGVSNPVYMEPIDSVEKIPKARWRLHCYLCRCKMGACIQCDSKFCYSAFHVTCARKAGLLIQTERKRANPHHGDDDSDSGGEATQVLRARCHKHVPPKLRDQIKIPFDKANAVLVDDDLDVPPRGSPFVASSVQSIEGGAGMGKGMSSAPLIPISRSASVLGDTRGSSKSARAYKKSYRAGPPLVPAYVLNRVLDYIGTVSLRQKEPLVAQVARFWSLKREARRGAPLLKRLHLEPWTASSQNKSQTDAQKSKKLHFLDRLRKDLEAVRMLAELVRKREKEKLRQATLLRDVLVNATLFPYFEQLRATLAKIEAMDAYHLFAQPVSRIDVPDYYDVIKTPMTWSTIREKLQEKLYTSVQEFKDDVAQVVTNAIIYNKAETLYHKTALRIQRAIPNIFKDLEEVEMLHLTSFEATRRSLLAEADPASTDLQLPDDVRDALLELRLETSVEHLRLLRNYEDMEPKELNAVRGPEGKPHHLLAPAQGGSSDRHQLASGREATPVHSVLDDFSRHFYRPIVSQARPKKVKARNASAPNGAVSTPNTRSRQQSSEVAFDSAGASERRASKRLKGESSNAIRAEQTPLATRSKKGSNPRRPGAPRPVSGGLKASSSALLLEPSVPSIAEDAEAEERTQAEASALRGTGQPVEGAKAPQTPKARGARALAAATPSQRSSRSTRSRPTNNEPAADDGQPTAETADATAKATHAHSEKGSETELDRPRKSRRGHVPPRSTTLETDAIDDFDSFKRFEQGWILPEDVKRNRGPRLTAPGEPLAKRPRKASAPTANGSHQANGANKALPGRPRSRTQPTSQNGSTSTGKDPPLPSDQTMPEGRASPKRGVHRRFDSGSSELSDLTSTVLGQTSTESQRSSRRRPSLVQLQPDSDADGQVQIGQEPLSDLSDAPSSPLTSEGEGGEDEDDDHFTDEDVEDEDDTAGVSLGTRVSKRTPLSRRTAPKRGKRATGNAGRRRRLSEADQDVDTESEAEADEEHGVPSHRIYTSRKSKVKLPPSALKASAAAGSSSGRSNGRRRTAASPAAADAGTSLFEPSTLVWARMGQYPHYAAEVLDEEESGIAPEELEMHKRKARDEYRKDRASSSAMRRQSSAATNASSASASKSASKSASPHARAAGEGEEGEEARLVLVRFFDKLRKWAWVPTYRLELMFEDEEVDKRMLGCKGKDRKGVGESYRLAKEQLDA